MKVLHVVGRKNNGKTSLISDLLAEFKARGLRVGTLKHCGHLHELDRPGKDSYRHRKAGATPACVLTPGLLAVYEPLDREEDPYARLRRAFQDCDLVLIEGDIEGPGPKIEVWRLAAGTEPLAAHRGDLAGLVTSDPVDVDIPVWSRDRVAELAEIVIRQAGEI